MASASRTKVRSVNKLPRRKVDDRRKAKGCQVHDLVVFRRGNAGNADQPIPARLTLLRPDPGDPSADQLLLDQLPIPRDAWRFDEHDRILSWQGAFGGGHLYVSHDDLGARGVIGSSISPCSVTAGACAQFLCAVALDCGATYETSGTGVTGLCWDPSSPAWTSATWIQERLLLTYTVMQGSAFEPPTFTFRFSDEETQALPWDALSGFGASIAVGEQVGKTVWNLTFKSDIEPPDDDGPNPSTGPTTVYPFWLQAVEDAAAAVINGVLEIDATAPQKTLVGMQGIRASAAVAGYYHTTQTSAPFGVFDGQLTIGGKPIARSRMRGDRLAWSGLDAQLAARTGLPASGTLRFTRDGAAATDESAGIKARRLRASAALDAIARHADLYPEAQERSTALKQTLGATQLDISGLLAMTPFQQNQQGAWGDVIQAAVNQDLSDIMNSFIPANMWNLLFPGVPQPKLTGELALVASSPVPGVPDPGAWYQSLATAVLTQGLAGGSDKNCRNLNGPRAAAWLKTQVASSAVYHTQGQMLFQYEWQQHFPLTDAYLQDQIANAATYEPAINGKVQDSVDDIETYVVTDSASDRDLKAKLIAQVREVGQYAITQKLYWAFAYYTYNTSPGILANIALQMGMNTGSSDGTALSRLFQQNATVLTALDPSGYFARQYTTTLNIFLATNILPSMFGFLGEATSYDVIEQYLEQWVQQNLHNEDQQIAEAAAQIQLVLQDQQQAKLLHDSIEALRALSGAIQDTLELPYVANSWVKWFQESYPQYARYANLFGSLLLGGVVGLAVYNLFTAYKSWDQLSESERAQVITDTTQLGLQIVAAVVKRGVRIYAIFGVDGMVATQRAAAISNILVTGEAEVLEKGLVKIGNTTARWLADTEGTIGKIEATNSGVMTPLLANSATAAAEEATWAAKVMGRNLDEFIATRVGPIFILAGIGFSSYCISQGEEGISLAVDALNIVSGSLMLFATIGGWAIEGGLIAAEGMMATIIAIAGPLAVIAALVGVALMLYELSKKPPDPVEEFVDGYAKPAGFYLSAEDSAIDYATVYANPDQAGLLMIGFSLSSNAGALCCNADGSIGAAATPTALPSCVWEASTDGLGMSQIVTVAQPDAARPPVTLFLSLMSDGSVSFQPQLPPTARAAARAAAVGNGPAVVTQTWLGAPQGKATLTRSGAFLASLPLTFQPVLPDARGNCAPAQASGWLRATGSGVKHDAGGGTTFTLTMSGMAPNYMSMVDMRFLLGSTPSSQQSFGPSFAVYASTPATFACTGSTPLPAFLTFSPQNGALVPNGQPASAAIEAAYVVTASNALGTAQASFRLTVAADAAVALWTRREQAAPPAKWDAVSLSPA
jgi:hypothetical protein